MNTKTWKDFVSESLEIVKELGLDPLPTYFDEITQEELNRIAAQGLPIFPEHWTIGRDSLIYRNQWETGRGQIMEIVIDAGEYAIAYISSAQGQGSATMTIPHVYGHSHVFNKNIFQRGKHSKNILNVLKVGVKKIKEYESIYGDIEVEQVLDLAFSLSDHVFHEEFVHQNNEITPNKENKNSPYPNDFYGKYIPISERIRLIGNDKNYFGFGERDLLRWIINYAPVGEWVKEILKILREVFLYQKSFAITKFLHEGFASYIHYISLPKLKIPKDWVFEIAKTHASVLYPSLSNPYWIGYQAIRFIKEEYGINYLLEKIKTMSDVALFSWMENNDSFLSFLYDELPLEELQKHARKEIVDEIKKVISKLKEKLYEIQAKPIIEIGEPGKRGYKKLLSAGNISGFPLYMYSDENLDYNNAIKVIYVMLKVIPKLNIELYVREE